MGQLKPGLLTGALDYHNAAYTVSVCACVLSHPVVCDFSVTPGSSVHGILQARLLELVAISFSRGSS